MTETKIMYKGRLVTKEQLIAILKKEFSKHIGEENSITIPEILEKSFPDYEAWSVWKKYTYIDIIKNLIGVVRRSGECFIINKKGNYFVIKTQDEADYYKNILSKDIVGMKKSIKKADEWVEEEKWKKL